MLWEIIVTMPVRVTGESFNKCPVIRRSRRELEGHSEIPQGNWHKGNARIAAILTPTCLL